MVAFASVDVFVVVLVVVAVVFATVEVAIAAQVCTSRECFFKQIPRDVTGSRGPERVREVYAVTLPETQQQGYFSRRREGMAVDRSIGGFRRGGQAFADVV